MGVAFLLVAFVPNKTDANPWFARIAWALGVKLVKNTWYARCNTRYVPAGMRCPGVVYGLGFSRNQAQNAARFYAEQFGDSGCGRCWTLRHQKIQKVELYNSNIT